MGVRGPGPAPDRPPRRRIDPRVVIACAPVAGLAAFALLEWAAWGAAPDSRARGGASELGVWQLLVAAGVIVWTVLAGLGLRLLGEQDSRADAEPPGGRRGEVARFLLLVYAVLASVLVIGALAGLRNQYVMTGQAWKIPALHVVAAVAMLPLLVVLKRVQLWAADDAGWSVTARDVERLRAFRRWLQSATGALGAVIALAVIATGALRQATVAAGLTPVPDTFVLVYGGFMTALVAAIYLHVFGAIEARARRLLDAAAPLPDPGDAEAFAAVRGSRGEIASELELGGDAKKNLEGLLAVLAPLVGALLTRVGGL